MEPTALDVKNFMLYISLAMLTVFVLWALLVLYLKYVCSTCSFCGMRIPKSTKFILNMPFAGSMCWKCAREKKDYLGIRGIDLENFCYKRDEPAHFMDGPIMCYDDDVGYFEGGKENGDKES
jgi:hypothetical protein